jgi:hypothetical protein
MSEEQASSDKRLAIIRLPLSEAQRRFVKERTGSEVTEALVSGMVSRDQVLENELVGEEAELIAAEIWKKNQDFVVKMKQAPKTLGAFQERIGHHLDPSVPNFAVFR